MYKTTTTYTVGPKTKLDKIFPQGLPVNAFIDKGRCGIGAFHEEMRNKSRCTIMTVPNISILLCKEASNPELDVVWGKIDNFKILEILSKSKPGHKIMSTPEGMRRIFTVANQLGRWEEIKTKWFLLLDEAHTFISEHYREDILAPFDYFWEFTHKSIISATPFTFTDERFQQLDYYRIKFNKPLGEVTLVESVGVDATLNYVLTHIHQYPGNLHIFYNSVTAIKDAVLRAGLVDCNIYCANDKDNQNMKTLGDLVKFYLAEPVAGQSKKVNFYTCKYFEGWDLEDANATMILVTDHFKPFTKIGVKSKGKQAFGRLRNEKYHKLIHITNHKYTNDMKSVEAFRQDYLFEANYMVKQNNDRVADFQKRGIAFTADPGLLRYADIDNETKLATLDTMKLDQQINEAANNEIYNNIDYIEQDWRDAYFDVKIEQSNVTLDSNTTLKRKSAATQLKEDYEKLRDYRLKQQNGIVISLFGSTEQDVKNNNLTAWKAEKYLDEATMILLKYNVKKVEAAIILKENASAEVKLLRLLANTFQVGQFYSNDEIKAKLQGIYDNLNIREENGKVKVANAKQLGEHGKFEITATKSVGSKGKPVHGHRIVRAQFGLKMAA